MVPIRSGLPEGWLWRWSCEIHSALRSKPAVILIVKGKFCVNMPYKHLINLPKMLIDNIELQ